MRRHDPGALHKHRTAGDAFAEMERALDEHAQLSLYRTHHGFEAMVIEYSGYRAVGCAERLADAVGNALAMRPEQRQHGRGG